MADQPVYTPWFNPPDDPPRGDGGRKAAGDRLDTPVYIYDEATRRAVNVAGVTGRPLLVDGPSGNGKTSLARHIAHWMDWEYLPYTVTSRTQAGDLLYTIDQLERLRDAYAQQPVTDMRRYIEPGVLWKAFDAEGAKQRAASAHATPDWNPRQLPQKGRQNGTVVLLDEIDKADPDVPNNLLDPLGSYVFHVDELDIDVRAARVPLVILTTNNERRLPDAFLRRCVNLTVSRPDPKRYISAGQAHFPEAPGDTLKTIADLLLKGATTRGVPSTAEYLDTVRACLKLNIDPKSADWSWLNAITAWKQTRRTETP